MEVIIAGYEYALPNAEDATKKQKLCFLRREPSPLVTAPSIVDKRGDNLMPPASATPKLVTLADGVRDEEVIAALIDRLSRLNHNVPSQFTFLAVHHLELALQSMNLRTADRTARGVEGTPLP